MRQALLLLSAVAVLAAAGCARESAPPAEPAAPATKPEAAVTVDPARDEFSYAEPDKVRIQDLSLDLAVDFDAKQISGTATYTLDWIDPKANTLVLDTRDLTITKVEAAGKDGTYGALQYALADADPLLGSKLTVQVPERNATVRIAYKTSPEASGLQWLAPSMTEGKKQPFMFSQSQQIHARSWVPLQDTTQVRFTYSAHVTAPSASASPTARRRPRPACSG